jgi:FAD/FMN-containing dehydrogenase
MTKILSMLLEGTICGTNLYSFVVPNSTIVNEANNRIVAFDASTGIIYVLIMK